ncbi:hypothetical protein JW935_19435 [candidate division KSB1 bacterium]|nr:hypothetical protein [candidate division KSB1 bacterium]
MDELKLFKVYYLGERKCWSLRIANSAEEALMQCFRHSEQGMPKDGAEKSCRAEEVTFDGYKISIEKI